MWLAWILVSLIAIWFFASRLLTYFLARIFSLFLKDAKFRLLLLLFQTRLRIKNLDINVSNIRLSSSIFSSEASNLITVIATGVSVDIYPNKTADDTVEDKPKHDDPRNSRTLLLLAQFLGFQLREVRVTVLQVPSLSDCRLEIQLGELRLDSSVIHRTKLSLALHLYQGNVTVKHSSQGPLLESNFALQASIQALVSGGRVSSVEDVNLDVDGWSLQLYSSLFHCTLQVSNNPTSPSQSSSRSSPRLSYLLPKAAQVKAECCSVILEHSDKQSQLAADLALLYICVKCSDPQRARQVSMLPDSHLTGQLSGLRIWANDEQEDKVVGLSKFQVLVQKEASTLHSDTQIHELSVTASR